MIQNESKPITCVGDFLKIVKELSPKDELTFFRGQSSCNYHVNSAFCRLAHNNNIKLTDNDKRSYMLANKLFQEFKNNIPIYSENNLLQNYSLNDLDMMMVAQHYGLATRLIDWSKSPLIALYFATEKEEPEVDCSVFMMYNVPHYHEVTTTSSQGFVSNVIKEQKSITEIIDLLNAGVLKDIDKKIELDLVNDVYNIINKHKASEFLNNPIELSKVVSARKIASLISHLIAKELEPKYLDVTKFIDQNRSGVNYLANLSNVTIFNDATYVIEPLPINHRIKNQQGVLVFSNKLTDNMITCEDFKSENIIKYVDMKIDDNTRNNGVFRIDISKEYIPEIHQELSSYGITKDFIFPELTSYTEVMQKRALSQIMKGKI